MVICTGDESHTRIRRRRTVSESKRKGFKPSTYKIRRKIITAGIDDAQVVEESELLTFAQYNLLKQSADKTLYTTTKVRL